MHTLKVDSTLQATVSAREPIFLPTLFFSACDKIEIFNKINKYNRFFRSKLKRELFKRQNVLLSLRAELVKIIIGFRISWIQSIFNIYMVILLVTGLKFVWTTSQRVRVIGAQVPVSAQYLFKGIRKCFLRCLVYYIYIFKYTKIDNVMNLHIMIILDQYCTTKKC